MMKGLLVCGMAAGVFLLVPLAASAQPMGAVYLITEGEAMLPPAPLEKSAPPPPSDGPVINLVAPKTSTVSPPFEIEVKFTTGPSGKEVDYDTFEATLLMFFNIDVTGRIKPYLIAKENRIYIKEAAVPSGDHKIKMAVSDKGGNLSYVIMKVKVE